MRRLLLAASLIAAAPCQAKPQAVGLYGRWGVFRDGAGCHAVMRSTEGTGWLAVVGRDHVALRPGYAARPGTVTLSIGGRRIAVSDGAMNGPNARAMIVMLRNGRIAILRATDEAGRVRQEHFPLTDAALALDAAAAACAR